MTPVKRESALKLVRAVQPIDFRPEVYDIPLALESIQFTCALGLDHTRRRGSDGPDPLGIESLGLDDRLFEPATGLMVFKRMSEVSRPGLNELWREHVRGEKRNGAAEPDSVVVAFPAPAPKPDPVIVMAAEWGAIQDEMIVHSTANPENKSGENMDRWEAALERLRALEDRIIETPATSIGGVALKLRIASHYECDGFDLADFHAVPAREINYDEAFGGRVRWETSPVISALLDVERMAGVS